MHERLISVALAVAALSSLGRAQAPAVPPPSPPSQYSSWVMGALFTVRSSTVPGLVRGTTFAGLHSYVSHHELHPELNEHRFEINGVGMDVCEYYFTGTPGGPYAEVEITCRQGGVEHRAKFTITYLGLNVKMAGIGPR